MVNDTSSSGGTPILFDYRNQLLAEPLIRQNPDITGPDGGNNTFFGVLLNNSFDSDAFANFFGTSAATPHVAGLAALMLDYALSPSSISTSEMELMLEQSCVDIVEDSLSNPLAAGFDFKSGFGLVQAVGGDSAVCGDIDHDGHCVNEDECNTDPLKTDTGACGCGVRESACHGRGGGMLRSYPTLMPPFLAAGGPPIIEEMSPVVVSEAVTVDRKSPLNEPIQNANVLSAASVNGESPALSCSSTDTTAYDLWLMVMAIFYLIKRFRRK